MVDTSRAPVFLQQRVPRASDSRMSLSRPRSFGSRHAPAEVSLGSRDEGVTDSSGENSRDCGVPIQGMQEEDWPSAPDRTTTDPGAVRRRCGARRKHNENVSLQVMLYGKTLFFNQ